MAGLEVRGGGALRPTRKWDTHAHTLHTLGHPWPHTPVHLPAHPWPPLTSHSCAPARIRRLFPDPDPDPDPSIPTLLEGGRTGLLQPQSPSMLLQPQSPSTLLQPPPRPPSTTLLQPPPRPPGDLRSPQPQVSGSTPIAEAGTPGSMPSPAGPGSLPAPADAEAPSCLPSPSEAGNLPSPAKAEAPSRPHSSAEAGTPNTPLTVAHPTHTPPAEAGTPNTHPTSRGSPGGALFDAPWLSALTGSCYSHPLTD